MPFRISKSFEIESGHMLAKHPEKCRFPHGHTRKIEFVLEASTLDHNEMVCDFKLVKDLMSEFLDGFDHSICMNTNDLMYPQMKEAYGDRVIAFERIDPTTEVMAETIFRECERRLREQMATKGQRYFIRPDVKLVRVRVWETSSSWAEYFE
jgi:6-pyruvoyltetrahydropterin/6-carboxytetrahydropterin synthase